jgi:hypothetical protein
VLSSPIDAVLDQVQALATCNAQLSQIPLLTTVISLASASKMCETKVEGKTESSALAIIPNTLSGLLSWLGL